MEAPAIRTEGLSRKFGELVAVESVSLEVAAGPFFGFLGPNGAGKSTTIKMLTGLLAPSAGKIEILGIDFASHAQELKRQIGVVPEGMALFTRLTGAEYLRFVGRMYGLDAETTRTRTVELLEFMHLADQPKKLIADYSHGMQKKLALAAAVIHGPRVLFLDEPFEGIDPVTSRTIKDILHSLQQRGVTLVLTSHILEVVERLCPLIAILDEGRIKGFGPLEDLRQGGESLEQLFVDLVGGAQKGELSWL